MMEQDKWEVSRKNEKKKKNETMKRQQNIKSNATHMELSISKSKPALLFLIARSFLT